MKKIFFLLCLLSGMSYALELDISSFEKIIQENPSAVEERLILARYNEHAGNELKALSLVNDALKVSPKHSGALLIKKRIQRKQKERKVFRQAGFGKSIKNVDTVLLQERLKSYNEQKEYTRYSDLYEALVNKGVSLDDKYHLQAASIYLWDEHYTDSKSALKRLKQKDNLDALKIKADICYYQGDYRCAIRYYEPLYQSSYSALYGIRLINSYLYLGELNKAERLYNFVHRSYPKNKELNGVGTKITEAKDAYLNARKKKYEDKPNVITLESYVIALYAIDKKDESLAVLRAYNKEHKDVEALRLEAKYLTWMGQTDKALKILSTPEFDNDLRAKLLMGQIYSWDHQFEKAKRYLKEVETHSQDKRLTFEASKALAFVMLWENDHKSAKKAFISLAKQEPKDLEIQEALMEINKDYAGLIRIYKKRLKGSQNSQKLQLRLGQLYASNNQKSKAIKQLRNYLKLYPNDLETTKALGQLLIEKKEYYEGFGYLEYYSSEKKTPEAAILLAQNYYWSGFPKEALDVLNQLLKKHPEDKKAQKLKGKILKVAPRFTSSNSGATINSYYNDLGKKQLELADTLYLNSHYKASLMYFESYLEQHPYAHKVRNRYALALENAQEYGKAEGEFALLLYQNKSLETRYHYAYNMMNNNKVDEAKKIFSELQTQGYRQLNSGLEEFMKNWEKAWESLNYSDYAEFYGPNYTDDRSWSYRKQALFAQEKYIAVAAYDPLYQNLGDGVYHIRFYQEYQTSRGQDKGYKDLWLKCNDKQTSCYITKEKWEKGEYEKTLPLSPYIDNALKELERLKLEPLALRSKKKSLKPDQRSIKMLSWHQV